MRSSDPVEKDLIAHVSALCAPPFGEVHRESDTIWFMTGEPDVHRNGILKGDIIGDRHDVQVRAHLERFVERGLPMMWWFFTAMGGIDPAIDGALRRNGLVTESDRPSMVLDLHASSPPTGSTDFDVERIRSEAEFRRWADVVGEAFGTPGYAKGPSVAAFKNYGFSDDAPFRHFIGFIEEEPAGAATLSLGGGVAGLANIATRPAFRRRGVARSIVSHVLQEAKHLGLDVAVLSADPAGEALYKALGFEVIGRHITYVTEPAKKG